MSPVVLRCLSHMQPTCQACGHSGLAGALSPDPFPTAPCSSSDTQQTTLLVPLPGGHGAGCLGSSSFAGMCSRDQLLQPWGQGRRPPPLSPEQWHQWKRSEAFPGDRVWTCLACPSPSHLLGLSWAWRGSLRQGQPTFSALTPSSWDSVLLEPSLPAPHLCLLQPLTAELPSLPQARRFELGLDPHFPSAGVLTGLWSLLKCNFQTLPLEVQTWRAEVAPDACPERLLALGPQWSYGPERMALAQTPHPFSLWRQKHRRPFAAGSPGQDVCFILLLGTVVEARGRTGFPLCSRLEAAGPEVGRAPRLQRRSASAGQGWE